jgi:hypothetical protein
MHVIAPAVDREDANSCREKVRRGQRLGGIFGDDCLLRLDRDPSCVSGGKATES